jgi:hypothetical protein
MLSAGFEPAIPASERPQTHALDRVATGIGDWGNFEAQIGVIVVCLMNEIPAHHKNKPRAGILDK